MIIGSNSIYANCSHTNLLFHMNAAGVNDRMFNSATSPFTIETNNAQRSRNYSAAIVKLGAKSLAPMINYYFAYDRYATSFNNLKYPIHMSFYMYINSTPNNTCYPVHLYSASTPATRLAFSLSTSRVLSILGVNSGVLATNAWYWVAAYITDTTAYLAIDNELTSGLIAKPASDLVIYWLTNAASPSIGRVTPVYIDEFQFKQDVNIPLSQLSLFKTHES